MEFVWEALWGSRARSIYREAGKVAQERDQAFAETLAPTLREMQGRGLSPHAMAREPEGVGARAGRGRRRRSGTPWLGFDAACQFTKVMATRRDLRT